MKGMSVTNWSCWSPTHSPLAARGEKPASQTLENAWTTGSCMGLPSVVGQSAFVCATSCTWLDPATVHRLRGMAVAGRKFRGPEQSAMTSDTDDL